MPFPLLIPAIIGLCKACAIVGATAFCVHKVTKAYEKNKEVEDKRITAQSKIDKDKINAANKIAEDAKAEATEIKKKYEKLENEINEKKKKIDDLKSDLQNPDLTEEERSSLTLKLRNLEEEIRQDETKRKSLLDLLKQKEDEIKNSIKIISSAGTGASGNSNWIKELITVENVLILGGCYILYKLVKDDK